MTTALGDHSRTGFLLANELGTENEPVNNLYVTNIIPPAGGANLQDVCNNGNQTTTDLITTGTGRVGIGGTPNFKLHIQDATDPTTRIQDTTNNVILDLRAGDTSALVRSTGNHPLLLNTNQKDRIKIHETGDVGFYEDTGATEKMYWDASNERLGVGTASPSSKLHISNGSSGATVSADADELIVENNGNAGISILTPSNNQGRVVFGDSTDNERGGFRYVRGPFPNTDTMSLFINGSDKVTFQSSGGINSSTGAFLTSGGTWTDASSEKLKQNITDLTEADALQALKELRPVNYAYTALPDEKRVGFLAEEVPELVAMEGRKGLSAMDIVAVLVKSVQALQKEVEELKATNTH